MPTPDAYRLKQAKGLAARRRGIPLPARILLVAAVVALGAVVFTTATGGLGTIVGALGTSLSGFVDRITATPEPSASQTVVADAPSLTSPSEPYTNRPSVDLQVTIPAAVAGDPSVHVRIYLSLEGGEPAPIVEVPVGPTIHMIVPIELTPGRNDLQATIIEAGIESEASLAVTYIFDTEPPVISLMSPAEGETINHATVTLDGTTQPRTSLLALNGTNGTSISGLAGSDGTFTLKLPLDPGSNTIRITGTDPAGNPGELVVSVVRGSGTLTSTLTASAYRISAATLPVSLQLTVLVTDPDGQTIEGAAITFTLTVPGIPPVSKDAVTAGDGRATFTTTLPASVTPGAGLATVLVATVDFGTTSAQKAITVVE